MNTFEYHTRWAVSVAHYIHNRIEHIESLVPIYLDDIVAYRKDIIINYGDLKGLDGFSAYNYLSDKYLVGINDVDFNKQHQRFTIAHELGHIFMKHHTINYNLPDYIQEYVANAFAGELLMPRKMMYHTAKYPTEYICSLFNVNPSAYNKRIEFLDRWENFKEKTNKVGIKPQKEILLMSKNLIYI